VSSGIITYVYPINTYYLPTRNFDNTITLATAQGYIDDLAANNRLMNFLIHILDDDAAGVDTWKTSDFETLLDYVISNKVYPITIKNLYDAQSGVIAVRKMW
jgi:hypothetical protein